MNTSIVRVDARPFPGPAGHRARAATRATAALIVSARVGRVVFDPGRSERNIPVGASPKSPQRCVIRAMRAHARAARIP
jgi:hypothetical protein